MATIEVVRPEEERRRRVMGIFLAVMAVLAAILLLALNPSLLVALTSDREGQALFSSSTLAPGAAATGQLTLANEGLLPLDYRVSVGAGSDEQSNHVVLRIRRQGEAGFLYQGPATARSIPIGRLLPGQRDTLLLSLQAPTSQATSSIPINNTFTWVGRSPGIGYWWWLLVVALALALAAFLLPRLLDLYARIRRLKPLPFELYWRVPLILAVLLAATLVPLTGVSLSSVNAQSSNPANIFAIGTIALTDRAPTGTTCISVPGRDGTNLAGSRCDAIFDFARMGPGNQHRATVTIRNLGTVPVGQLLLWTDGCTSANPSGEPAHGSADLCPLVLMGIHDDSHNYCYFPVGQPGECPVLQGTPGSVAAFTAAHPQGQPVSLNPAGLGEGIVFSFTLSLDPSAGNDAQGRALASNYYWEIISAT